MDLGASLARRVREMLPHFSRRRSKGSPLQSPLTLSRPQCHDARLWQSLTVWLGLRRARQRQRPVRGAYGRTAASAVLIEEPSRQGAPGVIEGGQGFIKEPDVSPAYQQPRQRGASLLARGEHAAPVETRGTETDLVHGG